MHDDLCLKTPNKIMPHTLEAFLVSFTNIINVYLPLCFANCSYVKPSALEHQGRIFVNVPFIFSSLFKWISKCVKCKHRF